MRILILDTYYPAFLQQLYQREPALVALGFDEQLRRLFAEGFAISDAYSAGLRDLGHETWEVIVNADHVQRMWASEHGLSLTDNVHDCRRHIVAEQVRSFQPDVLYVFEWCPLGDAFLQEMKSHVRLLAGQISSSLPANRTFAAYDVMVSSWPPIVNYFRSEGKPAEHLKLGFDARILNRLEYEPPRIDVSFLGGFGPAHRDRIAWLERLVEEFPVQIFGYGAEHIPAVSPIHRHWAGTRWGWDMYRVLRQSRITLNRHATIDVRGQVATHVAANMRLFEATGVGTCLLTDRKDNLAEMFELEREVATYSSFEECVEKVRNLLSDPERRDAISTAGNRRTLRDHTYTNRLKELSDIFALQIRNTKTT